VAIRLQLFGQPQSVAGKPNNLREKIEMKNKLMNLSVKMQTLLMSEEGQDLIEYALVVALIAFGAVAGMSGLATKINVAFGNIGTTLSSYIS
jgi:pilus assembly protein Flp/PilA